MQSKHPTLGRRTLADIYFQKMEADSTVNHMFINHNKQNSRYTNKKTVAYLLNPLNCVPILTTNKYLLPTHMREINAFDDRVIEIINLKFRKREAI